MDQLETELDLLYESDPAAARAEMESEVKRFVELLRLDATANPGNAMQASGPPDSLLRDLA